MSRPATAALRAVHRTPQATPAESCMSAAAQILGMALQRSAEDKQQARQYGGHAPLETRACQSRAASPHAMSTRHTAETSPGRTSTATSPASPSTS